MPKFHGQFIWYDLMTTDIPAAKAFYGAVMGWNMKDFDGTGFYTVLSAGDSGVGGIMELPKPLRDLGGQPGWIGYIAVDDVDAYAQKVQQAGGAIQKPAEDIPSVGRFAAVSDPQGAAFLLFKPSSTEAPPKPQAGTPGTIGWHELHTSDWEKSFGFYAGLFGWTKLDAMDMGPVGKYQIFATDTVMVGGAFNDASAKPHWLYYLNVADIDEAVARLIKNNGKVVNGPHQVPGGSWIVQALDPQGATFALTGPKA